MQSSSSFPAWRNAGVLVIAAAAALSGCTRDEAPAGSDPVAMTATIDLGDRVSVSGVSSGAYMAVQTHVALADRVRAVASIAGGPYHCAEGSVTKAIGGCMNGEGLDVGALASYATQRSVEGDIASLQALTEARVWVYHSPADGVVNPALADALENFYASFDPAPQIQRVSEPVAAHGWPTLDAGAPCTEMGGDFINACGYDAAGDLLRHAYGALAPRRPDAVGGTFRPIDLGRFFSKGSKVAGEGFAFVPEGCSSETTECRLHVAFHGCRQGAEFLGERFARSVGLNEWAAGNRIVVIYPQVEKSLTNPQGCWDWWGYTGKNYDLRGGDQIAGVAAMIEAFAAGSLLTP